MHYRTSEQLRHSIAGAGAGCSASIITCPLDVVKTRLQNQGRIEPGMRAYRGTFGTLYRIWTEERVRGLYRGLGPTVLGYLPTWAIYFSVYDRAKTYLAQRTGKDEEDDNGACMHCDVSSPIHHCHHHHCCMLGRGSNHWSVHIGAAVTAGVSCNVATNPLWVIKTRMMVRGRASERGTCTPTLLTLHG
ncbi:mitochondrial carrier domain-containing protein [Syncephalis pseudoplumigaleata]|uniref:Mitochondrial carrier domain-containing protein n=1 Tax=Syncephalis pseudoplumigaleata TaxID=1712513 RepID=A0A4P9YRX7_9FUNG|nr:mitochondrial carrier domain-containing protein [Syncephalis pseudoplumigaleata]|eukprot:RKP22646.1 mitochondrial carrier domain-containing protein [Syncephalis pseudoplumigaleata]